MYPIITFKIILEVFFLAFAVKQGPDIVAHEVANLALRERETLVSADSTRAPISSVFPVSAGDYTGSASSSDQLGQFLSKEAALPPGSFLHEGTVQSESFNRRLHQASPSSAAAGSSFILVFSSICFCQLYVNFSYPFQRKQLPPYLASWIRFFCGWIPLSPICCRRLLSSLLFIASKYCFVIWEQIAYFN